MDLDLNKEGLVKKVSFEDDSHLLNLDSSQDQVLIIEPENQSQINLENINKIEQNINENIQENSSEKINENINEKQENVEIINEKQLNNEKIEDKSENNEKIEDKYENNEKIEDKTENNEKQLEIKQDSEPETPSQKVEKASIFDILKLTNKKSKIILIIALLVSIINGLVTPLTSILMGKTLATLTNLGKTLVANPEEGMIQFDTQIKFLCSLYVGLAILTFIVSYIQQASWSLFSDYLILKCRESLFFKLIHSEIEYFDLNSGADMSNKLSQGCFDIQSGFNLQLGLSIQSMSCFIFSLAMGLYQGWKLCLIILASVPSIFIISGILSLFMVPIDKPIKFKKKGKVEKSLQSISMEILTSLKTIISFNAMGKEIYRYHLNLKKILKLKIRNSLIQALIQASLMFILFLIYALGFYYGSLLLFNQEYELSQILNVLLVIITGAASLPNVGIGIQALDKSKITAKAIIDIINEKTNHVKGTLTPTIEGEIEFKGVSFKYPSNVTYSLNNLSIKIPKGKFVAFVGSSGSGKSTSIQLIERFYDPELGDILIDGVPLKELNLEHYRSQIGLVGQEPILFNTTVYQNIAWGLGNPSEATLELVMEAAKLSNAHDFIMNLPDKYDTLIGEGSLSGGQKQRISIARAIIKKPKILLLDEATSALDTTSERIVQTALDNASTGRTTICIAHRLSTVRNADIIFVMDKGILVEQGNHNELLIRGGLYSKLVQSQTIKSVEEIDNKEEDRQSFEPVDIGRVKTGKFKTFHDKVLKKINIKTKNSSFIRLFKYCKGHKILLLLSCLGALGVGCVLPAFGLLFTKVLSSFSIIGSIFEMKKEINYWILNMVLFSIFVFIAYFLQEFGFQSISHVISSQIKFQMLKKLVIQEQAYFDEKENSILNCCSRLESCSENSKLLISNTLIFILNFISCMVVAFLISFLASWKLALVLLALVPLIGVVFSLEFQIRSRFTKHITRGYEKSNSVASQTLLNMRTVLSLVKEDLFFKLYIEKTKKPHQLVKKSTLLSSIGFGLSQSILILFQAFAYYYGSRLVINNEISVEEMFNCLFGVMFFGMSIAANLIYLNTFSTSKEAADQFFEIYDRQPKIRTPYNSKFTEVKGECTAQNVHFSYPSRPDTKILNGLTLELPRYKSIALVGPSGCGKSTFLQLIQRIYDCNSGHIGVEGINIKEWDLFKLREQISTVGQEPILLNYSIEDNIKYGKPEATREEVIAAAKLSNAHDFIMNLDFGYDTNVGERGGKLSGGQKQRIAIARALIRNPPLLLLDEATSALDSNSEKIVEQALDKACKGRTSISIAHRLSSIQNCDLIVVFKGGFLAEFGNHRQLMSKKGVYFELANEQNLS